MGMGSGVESRVPFLDYRLVEFVNRIPVEYKISNMNSKIILKDIAITLGFKRKAIYRPKMGFPTPIPKWIKSGTFSPYIDFIRDGNSSASELYDSKYAVQLLKDYQEGKGEHSVILWLLISLELWCRIFVDKTLKVKNPDIYF
jgi:asparagine synthase (glutamine-hydrolysing)